jgi:hypothetical protein
MQSSSTSFELQVFISSFEANTLEHLNSRRLIYLMEGKKSLLSKITVVDLNTEVKSAYGEKEVNANCLREKVKTHYKLVGNSDEEPF